MQGIRCVQDSREINVSPNVSFLGISGGEGFFCGLRQGGFQVLCWNFDNGLPSIKPERISKQTALLEIAVGRSHVCRLVNGTGNVLCWRVDAVRAPQTGLFDSISAGSNVTCGLSGNQGASCWDINGTVIQTDFDFRLRLVVAGGGHFYGIKVNGVLVCWGRNDFGQANAPSIFPFHFESLALGTHHSCAIWQKNKTVICWGRESNLGYPRNESFESIAAGDNYTCGLLSGIFSVFCWGGRGFQSGRLLSLPQVLPGPCSASECRCSVYPDSQSFCAESQYVCSACIAEPPSSSPLISGPSPSVVETPERKTIINRGLVAFSVVGFAGTLVGICTVLWCIWHRAGIAHRVHNLVQPTVSQLHFGSVRRQSSREIRRKRSRTSSNRSKHGDRAEEFMLTINICTRFTAVDSAAKALELLGINKQNVTASSGSSPEEDSMEARLSDFCQSGLSLDDETTKEALRLFRETKHILLVIIVAPGSVNLVLDSHRWVPLPSIGLASKGNNEESEDDIAPRYSLMEHPPLAIFVNGVRISEICRMGLLHSPFEVTFQVFESINLPQTDPRNLSWKN